MVKIYEFGDRKNRHEFYFFNIKQKDVLKEGHVRCDVRYTLDYQLSVGLLMIEVGLGTEDPCSIPRTIIGRGLEPIHS